MAFDHRNPQTYIVLAGVRSPSVARFVGAGFERTIEVRRGYGVTGGLAVYRGRKNIQFKVVFELADDRDWEQWYALKPLLDKDPRRVKPKALDIKHPLLEAVGITSVLIAGVSVADQTDPGLWTIEVEMLQYREPKLALSTVQGSVANAKAPERDPVDQEIEDLVDEMRKEAAQ